MTEARGIPQRRTFARIGTFVAERRGLVRDYLSAISGAGGRLVFSLAYFIALANTLSIAEFGMFATASAAGVMLSRILAFGFISALYRTATIRPNLIGTFTAGFLLLSVLSLPLLTLASWGVYALFFSASMPVGIFAVVIAAEALLGRPAELVMIVNNGMGKFGRAALLGIIGAAVRAAAAVAFIAMPQADLAGWAWTYLAANAVSLVIGVVFFFPNIN